MALYISILTILLLALVAGLLLTLHIQLKEWRVAAREAPLLAEKLTEAIMSARKGLADIRHELTAAGPDLSRLIEESGKQRVELQFLLQRADKVAQRMESPQRAEPDDEGVGGVRLAPEVQAVVERVAGANGMAAKPMPQPQTEARGGDPLEELLANLQTVPGAVTDVVAKSPKRKRSGPVTQAELDLQQSLKGRL